jgi:hypothetical protein
MLNPTKSFLSFKPFVQVMKNGRMKKETKRGEGVKLCI